MIEPETLIRWANDLVAFVNGEPASPLFTAEDTEDDKSYAAHRLPDELRTPEQIAALRATAKKGLAALAQSKKAHAPKKLRRLAEEWLDDDLVRSTHAAYNFTPMDAVLSLSASGRLQVVPRFRSDDAKFAATFAELIQEDSPALIKRCATCQNFFVYLRGARGQPRKLCDRHYEQSKQTKRVTK
jgi:hypothetical protein